MSIVIDGTGTISGVSATGISAAQTVTSVPSSALPAGTIIQVVNASSATETGNGTTTLADTSLSATITPKFATSKILVCINQAELYTPTSNTGLRLVLYRGATFCVTFQYFAGYQNLAAANICLSSGGIDYLDSPATTSATTYKTQFARLGGSGTVYVQNGGAASSTMTLMEIAQ